jgi:stage II sporulation protein P
MQTNKDLFDLIKETYPLIPSATFVSATENKLRHAVRKLSRKRKIKQFSFASSVLALFVIAMSWLFLFSGKEVITNQFYSFGEGKLSSTVNEEEPLVLIYQTHNQESFFSETNTKEPDKAWHETQNITLVGNRLSQELKERNINAIHDKSDVMETLKQRGLTFTQSYLVSSEIVNDALENNSGIKMAFDIHRDSKRRKDTTVSLMGMDYARIGFVISGSSKNYEENKKLAEHLHSKIEEEYPGLSKGVVVKTSTEKMKQNTYNQDLLNNSLLLEVGGVENTLEEEYRAVDVFAKVVAALLNTKTNTAK